MSKFRQAFNLMAKPHPVVMTVAQAAQKIFGEKSYRTIKAVHRLIHAGAFPNARKIDADWKRSAYVIPETEIDAFIAAEKKRGQADKV